MINIFSFFLLFPFFILAITGSFFIPGTMLINRLKLADFSPFERHILSWFTGISFFLLLSYACAYAQLPFASLIGICLIDLVWIISFIRFRQWKTLRKIAIPWMPFFFTSLGGMAMAGIMFFSGWQTGKGLQFFDTNSTDSIRHIAYINDQIIHFPPLEPMVSGQVLQGFHYFYDFLLSRFALFYHFPVLDLYFRFFPILLGILFGWGVWFFLTQAQVKKTAQAFILFLIYFSRSSSVFLLPFSFSSTYIDDVILQPLQLIVNPFTILSLGFLFCALGLLLQTKLSWRKAILLGILLGPITQIKVYTGLLAWGAIGVSTLFCILFQKREGVKSLILAISSGGIITALTYLPNNLGAGGLVWAPLLFFKQYMQSPVLSFIHWQERLAVYQQADNQRDIVVWYIVAILIFILLNFGLRLIVLTGVTRLGKKQFWHTKSNLLILTTILICISIPTFFVQSVSAFDTIQFFWILCVLLCIPTGILLENVMERLGRVGKVLLVVFVLILCIPGVFSAEYRYTASAYRFTLPTSEEVFLQHIATQIPQSSYFLLLPYSDIGNFPPDTPVITALSGREAYIENGWLPTKDEGNFVKRERQNRGVVRAIHSCLSNRITPFVKRIGTPYIITLANYPCLDPAFPIIKKETSSDGAISFYHIKM